MTNLIYQSPAESEALEESENDASDGEVVTEVAREEADEAIEIVDVVETTEVEQEETSLDEQSEAPIMAATASTLPSDHALFPQMHLTCRVSQLIFLKLFPIFPGLLRIFQTVLKRYQRPLLNRLRSKLLPQIIQVQQLRRVRMTQSLRLKT